MLFEIELDVLRFFDRTALEGLQIHSRYLRDLVDRQSRNLSIRYIHHVEIERGLVFVSLPQYVDGDDGVEEAAEGVWDPQKAFCCLNNAFIGRMRLNFGQENLSLLHYLRSNANDLQCQVSAITIQTFNLRVEDIDYALVNFMGVHLKPQIYRTTTFRGLREDYAMLFAHNALRGSIKHLVYVDEDEDRVK